MKPAWLVILLFFNCLFLKAQTRPAAADTTIYSTPSEPASFPGGKERLGEFLKVGIMYPAISRQNNVTGVVTEAFVIEKNGTLSNFRIIHGVTHELNAEAVRVMKSLPNWVPAKMNGQLVRQQFVLSISFSLDPPVRSGN